NSSLLFRKKHPQEGQMKSNSIINILCTVTPRKEMSTKDLQTIENINWDQKFAYNPSGGWKKSSTSVKNYGKLIYSSKVRFRFLHCQDIHECYLDLFQTHLHFLSNNTTGLTYQGTLPLKDLSVFKLDNSGIEPSEYSFQINGVSLNPIIVYCASEGDLDIWFGHLSNQVEINGGTVASPAPKPCARIKNPAEESKGREELRSSVQNEPIYEWEGSQRESLGPMAYVTKVRLQHLPCQDQHERLLVLYPSTLIILSDENNHLFYKGKLPLNMITVSTNNKQQQSNTFLIEGKLINPIVVSCLNEFEFHEWMRHLTVAQVPVHGPLAPVYDTIYTPTKKEAPELHRWGSRGSRGSQAQSEPQPPRLSYEPPPVNHAEQLLSPGYTEPLCFSSRPTSTQSQQSGHMIGRSSSMSSGAKPILDTRPSSLRNSSASRNSYASIHTPRSPFYNTPYTHLQLECPVPHADKLPLIKSNSWSTSHTSVQYQPSINQRHSDMCAPRKPLSPLYDDPYTPVSPSGQCWQGSQEQPALPTSFRLCTPPKGRRKREMPTLAQDAHSSQCADVQRAEAVSKLKLLPLPSVMPGHSSTPVQVMWLSLTVLFPFPPPDENAYLKPAEPDDLDVDYDNVWECESEQKMIHPLRVITPHRTFMDLGGRDVSAKSTQERWS
ncbi:PKHN1 protein, partial [Amia calva]|nr:PKHN1 protein [Amia calva]